MSVFYYVSGQGRSRKLSILYIFPKSRFVKGAGKESCPHCSGDRLLRKNEFEKHESFVLERFKDTGWVTGRGSS